jgi:hypothetical protein
MKDANPEEQAENLEVLHRDKHRSLLISWWMLFVYNAGLH